MKNSLALKSLLELKSIYDKQFSTNPRSFVGLMVENKEKSIEELIETFRAYELFSDNVIPIDSLPSRDLISRKAKQQMGQYNDLCIALRGVQDGN